MATAKILERKQLVIDEITNRVNESEVVVLAEYHGLSVSQLTELRRILRSNDADIKVYKNTLARRAFNSLNYNLDDELEGPKAIVFGKDVITPIKLLSTFAKNNPALLLKVGIVDKNIIDKDMLSKLASIPPREDLLTMFAAGLLEHVRNFAIGLNLFMEKLNDGKPIEEPKAQEPIKEEVTLEETATEETPVEETTEVIEEEKNDAEETSAEEK